MGDIAGLGEIGVDYSKRNNIPHDVQQQVFRAQLGLALKLKKPICLHIREANDDGFRVLKQVWLRHIYITGFSSQGRARLRAFLCCFTTENTQLSPSLTRKLCRLDYSCRLKTLHILGQTFSPNLTLRSGN